MPRVDFYLLQHQQDNAHWLFACRLLEKIYLQQEKVYVHTDNTHDCKKLDDLLWQFRDISFIPHCLITQYAETPAVIQIGADTNPKLPHHDILLNMAINVPDWYMNFKRVLVIVPQLANLRDAMRAQYKVYQTANCELHLHNM